MDKYLIINADDFGMCHAANAATFDLLEKGGITSATIMTPCGWAPEAIMWAKEHPQYAIGVHLTFTAEWKNYRWRPVSNAPALSLRDKDGYMHFHCDTFEANAKPEEVEAEIRAQVAFAKGFGFEPSHLDNHMGSLYGLEQKQCFLPLVFKICQEMGYPFRMMSQSYAGAPAELTGLIHQMGQLAISMGVPILDYLWEHSWSGEQSKSYEAFRDYMLERFHSCPDGIVETYIHPSLECEELKHTSSVWYRRVWEHRLFADPATRQHIESCGIKLINYRDLAAMRRAK